MADAGHAAVVPEGSTPSLASMPFPRRASFWGFATLFLLGIAFYLWWGLAFGVWVDNGVYAVVATLLGLGIAGMWLMMPTPNRPIPAEIR